MAASTINKETSESHTYYFSTHGICLEGFLVDSSLEALALSLERGLDLTPVRNASILSVLIFPPTYQHARDEEEIKKV